MNNGALKRAGYTFVIAVFLAFAGWVGANMNKNSDEIHEVYADNAEQEVAITANAINILNVKDDVQEIKVDVKEIRRILETKL